MPLSAEDVISLRSTIKKYRQNITERTLSYSLAIDEEQFSSRTVKAYSAVLMCIEKGLGDEIDTVSQISKCITDSQRDGGLDYDIYLTAFGFEDEPLRRGKIIGGSSNVNPKFCARALCLLAGNDPPRDDAILATLKGFSPLKSRRAEWKNALVVVFCRESARVANEVREEFGPKMEERTIFVHLGQAEPTFTVGSLPYEDTISE